MLTGTPRRAEEVAERRGWIPVWPRDLDALAGLGHLELWVDLTLDDHAWAEQLRSYAADRIDAEWQGYPGDSSRSRFQ